MKEDRDMNITFLIGNGFDLSCGLKCKYKDTYDRYFNSLSKNDNIVRFKRIISDNINTWADFELGMTEYARNFHSEKDFVECIRDYTNFLNNYLNEEQEKFFKTINQLDEYQYDRIIREMAISIATPFEGLTNNVANIIDNKINNSGMIEYGFISFNYTDVLDQLLLKTFSKASIQSLTGHACRYSAPIHIHGFLDKDVVLGVDNENQFGDLPYRLSNRGKRALIKPTFNNEYDKKRVDDTKNEIMNSSIIIVYGMSLGETDKTWRNAIFDWLIASNSHHLVYYIHRYESIPQCTANEKMDIEDDEKELLLNKLIDENYAISDDIRNILFDQIHIPIGNSIFDIDSTIAIIENERQSRIASLLN